jgi:hypothetical protein
VGKRHYSELPPVPGFTRVADDAGGRRMLRCDACGKVIPSLGVGYHRQGRPCWERAARQSRTSPITDTTSAAYQIASMRSLGANDLLAFDRPDDR